MAQDTNIVFPPISVSDPHYQRFDTSLTVPDFKTRFLAGVNLLDPNGLLLIDDNTIQFYINLGISQIEHDLNITLTPTTYTERRDYLVNNYYNYGFVDLYHQPIIDVTSVKVKYTNQQTLIEYPDEWLRKFKEIGYIQVTPTSGAINFFNIGNSGYLPQLLGVASQYPQLFEVTYIAGFEQNKIPYLISQLVGIAAIIPLLTLLNTSILGVGISGTNISLDGLTQGTNLFNHPKGLYGPRIVLYQSMFDQLLKTAKTFYRGVGKLMCT